MEQSEDDFELIKKWKEKFKATMDEIVKLQMEANPKADPTQFKVDYLIEKIATIFVGTVIQGRQIRELEKKLNESKKKT